MAVIVTGFGMLRAAREPAGAGSCGLGSAASTGGRETRVRGLAENQTLRTRLLFNSRAHTCLTSSACWRPQDRHVVNARTAAEARRLAGEEGPSA